HVLLPDRLRQKPVGFCILPFGDLQAEVSNLDAALQGAKLEYGLAYGRTVNKAPGLAGRLRSRLLLVAVLVAAVHADRRPEHGVALHLRRLLLGDGDAGRYRAWGPLDGHLQERPQLRHV